MPPNGGTWEISWAFGQFRRKVEKKGPPSQNNGFVKWTRIIPGLPAGK